MNLTPFKLERYFARYEFSARYLLSASDCETLSMAELLQMADEETTALWNQLHLGYTESLGHPLLRAEAASFYNQVNPRQVITLAPQEGILLTVQALLKPGDHVVAIAPAYQSLHEVARSLGAGLTPWTLQTHAGAWRIDLNALADAVNERTRLIVINFPNNPTGFLPSRAELETILAIAARRGCYVLSDEMYRCLEHNPAQRLPPVCTLYERGVSLSGLSKAFGLPGLRLGWLATQDKPLFERLSELKDYTTICNSAPGEILGIIALRQREALAERCRAIIGANLRLAEEFFKEHQQRFGWLAPQAGSVAFPQYFGAEGIEAFCKAVVEEKSLMIVPGSMFDHPGQHFRIGLGRKNFAEALDLLNEYCLENPR